MHFALYDWTREMPRSKRLVTWAGILIQGYAIYAGFARTLVWPLMWPRGPALYIAVFALYFLGSMLMNGMLTSELARKTQLESDQIAARRIQQTLIPQQLPPLAGYELESFYKPFREVGGDTFDVIDLPGNQTLLIAADVSGKGVAAALLAANIQALVRSIASAEVNPEIFATRINQHLSQYAPPGHFATALFLVLDRDSGALTFVNAGHNPPILYRSGSGLTATTTLLEATGTPLGLFADAPYTTGQAVVHHGDTLLLYTDGLTDSIAGDDSERRIVEALAQSSGTTMSNLKRLINPSFNEDDVTILALKRHADSAPTGAPAASPAWTRFHNRF
jgi:sigma-B regulation protein RsbU (phosphoserine phosphatase)